MVKAESSSMQMHVDGPIGDDFLPMHNMHHFHYVLASSFHHDNSQTDTICKILMDSDMVS